MQAYYRSVLGQDAPASPEERQALRRAMIDYGALQPSPVQKATETTRALDTSIVATSLSPQQQNTDVRSSSPSLPRYTTNYRTQTPMMNTTMASQPLMSPPTTVPTPNGYNSTFSWTTPQAIPPLEADETFNLDSFDLTNAELEEMMMNATQDFWASFPGEVGVGYQ